MKEILTPNKTIKTPALTDDFRQKFESALEKRKIGVASIKRGMFSFFRSRIFHFFQTFSQTTVLSPAIPVTSKSRKKKFSEIVSALE